MDRKMYLKLFLLIFLFRDVLSAKILAIMVIPSASHLLWYTKYLEALLRRGHSITYIGVDTIKPGHQNLRQIVFENLKEDLFGMNIMVEHAGAGPIETRLRLDQWDNVQSNYIKKSEIFQRFLKIVKTEEFDLIIHDIAMNIFLLGAADILKNASLIGITPFGRPPWILDLLKNPIMYSSHPHYFLSYGEEMSFFERVGNLLYYVFTWTIRTLNIIEQDKHAKDSFGEDIAPLEKIMERMHIIMVNTIDRVDFPYAKVPGLIHVGGLHIDPPKKLPPDIQSYLDNATHGAICFSLGSNIQVSQISKDKIEIILKALKQIAPIKVLMKWERYDVPFKADNIKVWKWMPQSDILAHPNTKLFFTHSGLLGTQEAIYHGVPMLGMPFMLDQSANLKRCMEKGIAEELDYFSMSTEEIVGKMKKIINNPKYRENAKRLSEIFKDSMDNPRDRAVFWTEYAIRHKGAPHLSTLARKLPWYANSLFDVYLFFLLVLLYVLYIVYKILQIIARYLRKEDVKTKTS